MTDDLREKIARIHLNHRRHLETHHDMAEYIDDQAALINAQRRAAVEEFAGRVKPRIAARFLEGLGTSDPVEAAEEVAEAAMQAMFPEKEGK